MSARLSSSAATRRGFSVVEAIVCVGVLLLLIGILVPSLAKSRDSARMTRDLAIVRTCTTLLHAYCTESKGLFPAVGSDMHAPSNWWRAVVSDDGASKVDPVGVRETGAVRLVMSACFVVSPDLMEPGQTLHIDLVPIQAMTDASVVFPNQKGAFYMQPRLESGREVYWNMVPAEYARPGPISFFDGAGTIARWPDFDVRPAYFEYWVGMPVYATWHGVRGRDTRRTN